MRVLARLSGLVVDFSLELLKAPEPVNIMDGERSVDTILHMHNVCMPKGTISLGW
jgi:hypothetical protein